MNQINRKRNSLHEKLRKQYRQSVFTTVRNIFKEQGLIKNCQQILTMSLLKNGLINQIRSNQLLQRLYQKIHLNPTLNNQIFIILISSNLLQDDISLEQKQYIADMCLPICQKYLLSKQKSNSQLIRNIVYFYINIMICYQQFDQDRQLKIEQICISHLIEIFKMVELIHRFPNILEDIEIILLTFYTEEDKYALYYRISRTKNLIDAVIDILDVYHRNFGLFFARISSCILNVVHLQQNTKFIKFILNSIQLNPHQENLFICLSNMLSQEGNMVLQNQLDFKIIMSSLQKDPCSLQKLQTLKYLAMHPCVNKSQFLGNIIEFIIVVLRDKQSIELKIKSVQILKALLIVEPVGIAQRCLRSFGGISLLKDLEFSTRNQQLSQSINQFWIVCLDIQI